jgi:hypothetical protein
MVRRVGSFRRRPRLATPPHEGVLGDAVGPREADVGNRHGGDAVQDGLVHRVRPDDDAGGAPHDDQRPELVGLGLFSERPMLNPDC